MPIIDATVNPNPTPDPTIDTVSFLDKKNYGADIFKQNAMNKVTVDDIDKQLAGISDKKTSAFADMVKFYKSQGLPVDPAEITKTVKTFRGELDDQARSLVQDKQSRVEAAAKSGEMEYQSMASSFLDARKKQAGIDKMIQEESYKPITDPNKIVELKKQKDEADKKVDSIKKDFAKNGITEPDAIVKQQDLLQADIKDLQNNGVNISDQRQILMAKYPDQAIDIVKATSGQTETNADHVLYATALGQYDNADGQFQPKAFMKDLQSVPEYRGLPKEQIVSKLIDTEQDPNTLKDVFFVANNITDDPSPIIKQLITKGMDPKEIAKIALEGYLSNLPKARRDISMVNAILAELKPLGLSRSEVNNILQEYATPSGDAFTIGSVGDRQIDE